MLKPIVYAIKSQVSHTARRLASRSSETELHVVAHVALCKYSNLVKNSEWSGAPHLVRFSPQSKDYFVVLKPRLFF